MPPIRSITTTKPVKTERTHEENQERAYIAASRRSDRSLEARVESARRASEIHKRRTGRSLRVTEQDVINEEMYEEEDDDLPLQYRRLTAHLNTNSTDFNRRLAAYLTNHVAMRTALDQAISSSYAQQYSNTQNWAPQPFSQMQPPWMANGMQNQPLQSPFVNPMTMQPQMMHNSPTSFRQTPYPMPMQSAPGYRPNMQRPSSIATQQTPLAFVPSPVDQQPSPIAQSVDQRRPSSTSSASSSGRAAFTAQASGTLKSSQRNSSSTSLPNLSSQEEPSIKKSSSVPPANDNDSINEQALPQSFNGVAQFAEPQWSPSQQMNMSPFASSLPPDAQMFFDPSFNPNAFQPSSMMNSAKAQQPFYSYNPNSFNKPRHGIPSYEGMNQTLAPGPHDSMSESSNWPTPPSTTTESAPTPFTPAFGYSFDPNNGHDVFQKGFGMPSPDMQRSGYVTPAEAEWTTFIDPSSWADPTAA